MGNPYRYTIYFVIECLHLMKMHSMNPMPFLNSPVSLKKLLKADSELSNQLTNFEVALSLLS